MEQSEIDKLTEKVFDPTQDLSLAGRQRRLKRGLGSTQLMEAEIKDAQSKARSALEASRVIGVSYNTYKKYAKMYGIFEDLKNPKGYGVSKGYNIKRGVYALDEILAGKFPEYPSWKLKQRLLKNGYMQERCNNCGFDEKRLTDNRVPLVLDYLDGDRTNHQYDNLQMLCLNCTYLLVGNLSGNKKEYSY